MSQPRRPTTLDIERMQRALALVTAYDIGTQEEDFTVFRELAEADTHPEALSQALAQFAWLLLKSMEENGLPKDAVLRWYGEKFAAKHQDMLGDP